MFGELDEVLQQELRQYLHDRCGGVRVQAREVGRGGVVLQQEPRQYGRENKEREGWTGRVEKLSARGWVNISSLLPSAGASLRSWGSACAIVPHPIPTPPPPPPPFLNASVPPPLFRGITEELGEYLRHLIYDKEQKEYVAWLSKVRDFVK